MVSTGNIINPKANTFGNSRSLSYIVKEKSAKEQVFGKAACR